MQNIYIYIYYGYRLLRKQALLGHNSIAINTQREYNRVYLSMNGV